MAELTAKHAWIRQKGQNELNDDDDDDDNDDDDDDDDDDDSYLLKRELPFSCDFTLYLAERCQRSYITDHRIVERPKIIRPVRQDTD